jgi:hypothetical protein
MTNDDIIRMVHEAGFGVTVQNLERLIELAVAAEREECAKVCDGYWPYNGSASECAAAIRARGDK